jgi:hypothetical protein
LWVVIAALDLGVFGPRFPRTNALRSGRKSPTTSPTVVRLVVARRSGARSMDGKYVGAQRPHDGGLKRKTIVS